MDDAAQELAAAEYAVHAARVQLDRAHANVVEAAVALDRLCAGVVWQSPSAQAFSELVAETSADGMVSARQIDVLSDDLEHALWLVRRALRDRPVSLVEVLG